MIELKIVVFEPHPDDLLFGPGPILLDWIKEGTHEIHVITVTDGRACYRFGGDVYSDDVAKMTENDVASMRTTEARQAIKFLGLRSENHHLLNFHDADGQKYVKDGIKKVKPIIKDADRLVIDPKKCLHVDHQASHDIAIGAAKELKLNGVEFFVFCVPSYGRFQPDSKEKQFKFIVTEEKANILKKWLEIYQSQAKIKYTWKMYTRFVKNTRSWTYGTFSYDDIGKYINF